MELHKHRSQSDNPQHDHDYPLHRAKTDVKRSLSRVLQMMIMGMGTIRDHQEVFQVHKMSHPLSKEHQAAGLNHNILASALPTRMAEVLRATNGLGVIETFHRPISALSQYLSKTNTTLGKSMATTSLDQISLLPIK